MSDLTVLILFIMVLIISAIQSILIRKLIKSKNDIIDVMVQMYTLIHLKNNKEK